MSVPVIAPVRSVERVRQAPAILGAAALLGVAGDALLRAPGPPGLNFVLMADALALAALLLMRRSGRTPTLEAMFCLGLGVVCAAGMLLRDAPPLKLLALGTAALLFALPAFRAGRAWLLHAGVGAYIAALGAAALHAFAGMAVPLHDARTTLNRSNAPRGWATAGAAARGLVLALPLLVVFGALFISADAVFAALVADAVGVNLELVVEHVVLTGFVAWVSAGYLSGFVHGTRVTALRVPPDAWPRIGIGEAATALGLLGALFAAFVAVQFRYLFGGADIVALTPDLTYAEYARRGFLELVAVVALMVPVLLVADHLLRRRSPTDERVFRALTGVQLGLIAAVMVSAVQRLRLYVGAYGLTEQRFYAAALLVLLAVVLAWFAATVLRGRRRRFASGALAALVAGVIVLQVVNPDAVIARTNLARAELPGGLQLDASYASSLSADAVPVLLAGRGALDPDARCRIAARMLKRWGPDQAQPLRAWNWSVWRAQRAVRAEADALTAEAAGCVEGQVR